MKNSLLVEFYFDWVENCLAKECAAEATYILSRLVLALQRFGAIEYRRIANLAELKVWQKEQQRALDFIVEKNNTSSSLNNTLLGLLTEDHIGIPDNAEVAPNVTKGLLLAIIKQLRVTDNPPVIRGITNEEIADILMRTIKLESSATLSFFKQFATKILMIISTSEMPAINLLPTCLSHYFDTIKFDVSVDASLQEEIKILNKRMMMRFSSTLFPYVEKTMLENKAAQMNKTLTMKEDFLEKINRSLGKKFHQAVLRQDVVWDFSDHEPNERYITLKDQQFAFSSDPQECMRQKASIRKRLEKAGIPASNVVFVEKDGCLQLRITEVLKHLKAHCAMKLGTNRP